LAFKCDRHRRPHLRTSSQALRPLSKLIHLLLKLCFPNFINERVSGGCEDGGCGGEEDGGEDEEGGWGSR